MNKPHTKTLTLANGRQVILETGFLAQQAHGAVTVKTGNTVILATVVEKKEDKPASFLPLTVEYRENFAADGKIPGSYHRRESRLNEYEILTSRLIDRSIRPLFPQRYFNNLQVNVTLLSHDDHVDNSNLALLAASAALSVSPLPFLGPVASVRVGKKDNSLCINPTPSELEQSPINVVVAGTKERILMLEGSMQEITDKELIDIVAFARASIKQQCVLQDAFAQEVDAPAIDQALLEEQPKNPLEQKIHDLLYKPFYAVAHQGIKHKKARAQAFADVQQQLIAQLDEKELEEEATMLDSYIANVKRDVVRDFIINEKQRIDGRKTDEIRPIDINVDYLPSAHGSAVFTRGSTQVLATVTLGSPKDVQYLDGVSVKSEKKYLLHYNFPGFSTGDVKPNRGPGRREIGHGNLAWHAIQRLLPETPYTIRITADTMSSDGSSSMATVCGGSLALMDAGIQIAKPVAGIAMGLIHDPKTGAEILLSDIKAEEDVCGNVDLKITATQQGITACQMDIKDVGISFETLGSLLAQAKAGITHILSKMNAAIAQPRQQLKPQVPIIQEFSIKPSMMGTVIGPRGKMIQQLQETTQTTIQIADDGTVTIFAPNSKASTEAYEAIQVLVSEPEVEKVYTGKIKSFTKYGAFIEFLPQKEGLLHVTEMGEGYIEDPSKLFEVGQALKVKLISITKPKDRNGRTKFALSIKQI